MPTVAILGASADRSKFGNKAVRAFLARGYMVYPVNPKMLMRGTDNPVLEAGDIIEVHH